MRGVEKVSRGEIEVYGTQEVGDNGEIFLLVGVEPDYYRRNYLYDGVDVNLNGKINSAERLYAPGKMDAWSYEGAYRHRFLEAGDDGFIGLEAGLLGGYGLRFNYAPFESRDSENLSFGPTIEIDFGKRMELVLTFLIGQATTDKSI